MPHDRKISKALCFKKCNRRTSRLCPRKTRTRSIPLSVPPANGETRLARQSPPVLEPKRAGRETYGPPGCNFEISFTDFLAEQTVAAMSKRVNNDKTDISSDHHCEGRAQDWNRKSTLLISIRPIRHIILQPWHLRHWDFTNFCSSTSVRLTLQLIFVPDSFWEVREGRYLQ